MGMIWCVEDDASIRDIELYALNSAGFIVRGFEDGITLWDALKNEKPDLLILDVMLPGMNGIKILSEMKASAEYKEIPIILATAKGEEYDRIKGLDLGADDYIVKPFSIMEMIARAKAVLRRSKTKQEHNRLQVEGLVVDLDEHTVTVDGKIVQLTYKEFELLCLFLTHPGVVCTREQLFAQVWKTDYIGETRTLDSHIRTLRQKIGAYGKMIETVRNVGYRLEVSHEK